MSRRTEMLGSTIRQELAMMIMRDLNDPRVPGITSITRVKVSEDLSIADVFVTIMGTPGQQTAALNALKHSAGMMRSKLTKALSLRTTPFINFRIDENLKKELEMQDLLRKVAEENEELDRRRAQQQEQEPQTDPSPPAAQPDEAPAAQDDRAQPPSNDHA